MGRQKICLNMIVKNEGKVISECLEHVAPFIHYYVINDTGSTDDTCETIKAFFDAKNIPGEIIRHDFKTCECHPESEHKQNKFFHFGHNRTYALNKCKGKGDYILFMDADDAIEGKFTLPAKLTADQYYLTMRTDQNTYYRPILVKNDPKLKWVWRGGLHEFLSGKPSSTLYITGDYAIVSRRLGARNEDPLKYYKDAQYLEELLKESVDDDHMYTRYLYYYAQSWFDAKEYQKTIDAYNQVIKRATEKGEHELAFSSRYMIGRSHVLKGSPDHVIEKVFQECFSKHPTRAEPIFQLVTHYSNKREYQKAYDWGIKGVHLEKPRFNYLYVDHAVYDYRLLDELIFCASQIGRYRQAIKWCTKLIKEKRAPPDTNQLITQNILALQDLIDKLPESAKREPDSQKPSICFYVGPSPIFDKEFFGSELAVLYLANELSHRYNVYVAVDDCQRDLHDNSKTFFIDTAELSDMNIKFDIMIVSRYINYFIEFDSQKIANKTYLWLHDIDVHTYWNKAQLPHSAVPLVRNIDHLIHGYVCLSEWHHSHIQQKYSIHSNKLHIIGNGINTSILGSSATKTPGKFIWISDYTRGLLDLVSQFHKIIKILPNAHLDVYRRLPDEVAEALKKYKFVNLKGHASHDAIMAGLAEAEYWYYPTAWSETYCISAHEAQAMGCLCIASDVAALRTTIADRGILLKEKPHSEEFWNEGLKAIMAFEGDKELKLAYITKAVSWARQTSWTAVSKEWLAMFDQHKPVLTTAVASNNEGIATSMFNRFKVLRNMGFAPKRIIDIGANVGDWNLAIKSIFDTASITSYEANPECASALEAKKLDYKIMLLGSENKDNVDFFTLSNQECATGASIFKEATSFYDDENRVKTHTLPMRRLDDVLSESHIDLLKLDVQGAELMVLEGAKRIMSKTDFILLEVSIMKYNNGSPLFAEVVEFMNKHNFKMFDLVENHYLNGCCMQSDVLFLNAKSRWCTDIAKRNASLTHWKVDNIYS